MSFHVDFNSIYYIYHIWMSDNGEKSVAFSKDGTEQNFHHWLGIKLKEAYRTWVI